jgi:hypothetical protein
MEHVCERGLREVVWASLPDQFPKSRRIGALAFALQTGTRASCRLLTRRATRMDARRFPTEPRIGESENPRIVTGLRFALSGGRPFSLVGGF